MVNFEITSKKMLFSKEKDGKLHIGEAVKESISEIGDNTLLFIHMTPIESPPTVIKADILDDNFIAKSMTV